MRGLNQRMSAIITAREGTETFLAQVEAVSEITGMAAEDVINFRKAMVDLKKPMTEAQELQKAYDKQTALVGDAFKQLREAGHALLMRGLMPIMPYVTSTVKWLAGIGRALASWEPLIPVVVVGMVGASTLAIYSLSKLGWQILKFAMESKVAGELIKAGKMPDFRSLASIGKFIKMPWLGGATPFLTAGAGILGAGAIGYGIGTVFANVLEKYFPNNVVKRYFQIMYDWYHETKQERTGSKLIVGRGLKLPQIFAKSGRELAQALAEGRDPSEILKMIDLQEQRAMKMYPELHGGAGRRYALDAANKTLENAALVGQLTRGTVKTEADRKEDKRFEIALNLLGVQKAQLEAQLKIQGATRSQAENAEQEKMRELQRQMNSIWRFQDPAGLSNRNSYSPFNPFP
jgi:hypothetical protein